MTGIEKAAEWCRTDEAACRDDIARLGLAEAARYNVDLINEATERGDTRWDGVVSIEDMTAAMGGLV